MSARPSYMRSELPSEHESGDEPLLIEAARRMALKEPRRHICIVNGTGTWVGGFLAEVDSWIAGVKSEALAGLESPEAQDVFRKAWNEADERGEEGSRVAAGLSAVAEYLRRSK